METFFTVNQAAFILRVHPLTIRRYIREGKLKAHKIAGNVRIKEAELQEFNSKEVTPEAGTELAPKKKRKADKSFLETDPFLKLKGRGASLYIPSI